MTTVVRNPPYDTEKADASAAWGSPEKAIAFATAVKSSGQLSVKCFGAQKNESGGTPVASVGITKIGPPTRAGFMEVNATVDIDDEYWHLWSKFYTAEAWGRLTLEVTSSPEGQEGRTEDVEFNESAYLSTIDRDIKNKSVTLYVGMNVDTEHSYQATVYAMVQTFAAGVGKYAGSLAWAGIDATVQEFFVNLP